ncbi:MAG: hypothetical protein R3F53_24310 [Gammaproteobacteria bacterium]
MSGFLVRRLLASLLTALLASMVVFAIVRTVPGDIVMQMMGQSSDDPRAEAALRAFFGLDQPLYRQYLDWLWRVLQGDLGRSWNKGLDVADAVWSAFLVTLELGLLTLLLATFIGVPWDCWQRCGRALAGSRAADHQPAGTVGTGILGGADAAGGGIIPAGLVAAADLPGAVRIVQR